MESNVNKEDREKTPQQWVDAVNLVVAAMNRQLAFKSSAQLSPTVTIDLLPSDTIET